MTRVDSALVSTSLCRRLFSCRGLAPNVRGASVAQSGRGQARETRQGCGRAHRLAAARPWARSTPRLGRSSGWPAPPSNIPRKLSPNGCRSSRSRRGVSLRPALGHGFRLSAGSRRRVRAQAQVEGSTQPPSLAARPSDGRRPQNERRNAKERRNGDDVIVPARGERTEQARAGVCISRLDCSA